MATGETAYQQRSGTGDVESAPRGEAGRPAGRERAAHPANGGAERMARALGWLSIGLGLAEVAAPHRFGPLIGIADTSDRRRLLRVLGLREILSGAGLLRARRPAGWLWSRVGGDAIDLGLLGRARMLPDADQRRVATATLAVAGVTALDVLASERASRGARPGIRVRRTITIAKPPGELYELWHDLARLPTVFRHVESVDVTGPGRSRWKAKAPAGTTVEWDAEVVDDQPNRRIGWRSMEGATVPNRGAVEFLPAPGGRGTIVHVDLEYDPPAGALGKVVASLLGREPGQQIAEDLRRLKQRLETGEITTAQGPSARRRGALHGR